VGALGSLGFMFVAGRRTPTLLLVIFTFWVLAPWVGLALADKASKRWPAGSRAALHGLALLVTLVSLAIYGYVALGPPRQGAFWFVLIPPASCVLIAAVWIVAFVSGKRTEAAAS